MSLSDIRFGKPLVIEKRTCISCIVGSRDNITPDAEVIVTQPKTLSICEKGTGIFYFFIV